MNSNAKHATKSTTESSTLECSLMGQIINKFLLA